jgi:hypothetical protein
MVHSQGWWRQRKCSHMRCKESLDVDHGNTLVDSIDQQLTRRAFDLI